MIQPIGDRIIVQPIEQEEVTSGGIVLPGMAKEKPQQGKVIAVGKGLFRDGHRIPLDVKVGDVVLFNKFGGVEAKVEGQEVLVMHEADILAIIQ